MPAPNVPTDIGDTIRTMQEQIRALQGAVNTRPAMNQVSSGSVTIGAGGTLRVNDTDGAPLFFIGGISPLNPDGSLQRGLLAYRQDGSLALSISNGTANVGDPQAVVIRDADSNTLFAEDAIAGGLAAPLFGADAWYGVTEVPAWTTSSATFVTLMTLSWRKQHPRVTAHYLARCSDGTTAGELRLVDGAGLTVATVVLGAGAYVVGSVTGSVSGTHLASQSLQWQGRVTAGAGTVGVRGLSTFGVGS
jgi:hypothetical protein